MSEGRTLRAGRNIIYGLVTKVIMTVLDFVTRMVFIEYLGEELLGINGVFKNIIQLLSLAELGFANVVNFSFYKPIADGDERQLAALIRFYKKVYNAIACIVTVIGLSLMPFLEHLVNVTTEIPNLHLIYLLFLGQTVASYLFVYKATLLRADQKGYILTRYELICNFIAVVAQILAIRFLQSIYVYLGISMVYTFVYNLLAAHKANKDYPYLRRTKEELTKEEKREITGTIKSGFIYKISGVLLNSTDNILISTLVGTVWVGYLANYESLMLGISAFYTITFSNITASVGNLVASESKEKRYEVFRIMLTVSAWLALVFSACFFILSKDFVTIWLGEKFVLPASVVLPKALMLFLSCMLQPVFCFREATGLYRKIKYAMLSAALINIGLSIVMGKIWGMSGILIASLIAMALTYLWYEPKVLYKDCFGQNVMRYFAVFLRNIALTVLAMLVLSYVSSLVPVSNLFAWVIKAIVVFILLNVYSYCIFRKTEAFLFVKNMLLEGIGKWRRKA